MKILGIESSSLVASIAIVEDENILAEYTVNFKKTHSQTLLPMLDEVMRMLGMELQEIDAIAVSGGPGSFTGLRIGAATAKGLGFALQKPLIHVPTLDATAYNLCGSDALICPIMDARRNQVYNGLYYCDRDLKVICAQRAVDMHELILELNARGERVIFLGDGVPVYQKMIENEITIPYTFAMAHQNRQRAASVASLGLCYARENKMVSASDFAPNYLRKSQAERERRGNEKAVITKAEMGDVLAIQAVENLCFKDAWTKKMITSALEGVYDEVYVYREKESIVGYIDFRIVQDEAEVFRIAVVPEKRKMHCAWQLMEVMQEVCRQKNIVKQFLEVRVSNEPAIALYQKYGFVEIGRRKEYYINPVEDAILMKKEEEKC